MQNCVFINMRFMPVLSSTQYHFNDGSVAQLVKTHSITQVKFPFGIQVQVNNSKKLMVLLVGRQEMVQRTECSIIFQTSSYFFGKTITGFNIG